jgi:hypothetical protein
MVAQELLAVLVVELGIQVRPALPPLIKAMMVDLVTLAVVVVVAAVQEQ